MEINLFSFRKKSILMIFLFSSLLLNIRSIVPNILGSNSINDLSFDLVDYSLENSSQQGIYNFNVTVQNSGDTATAGVMPISWEKVLYTLSLSNGIGTLEESVVDLDINGDGDKTDDFEVTWFHNDSRQWDAVINDGVNEIHAYSLDEGPSDSPGIHRTYYINGKPKLFNLGGETHTLYGADNDEALFGLGNAIILKHPSPHFELLFDSKITAPDFKIDGKTAIVNHTYTGVDWSTETKMEFTAYIITGQSYEVGAGKEVTFSCSLIANENVTSVIYFIVNWSPDGNTRHAWVPVYEEAYEFVAAPTTDLIPGFSVITLLLSLTSILFLRQRRKLK
ncbi:MAG: Loki-CTERM sorting domain-containing protein [Candidatus Hodarchaeales archaeon]|jgi:hypothetical protein